MPTWTLGDGATRLTSSGENIGYPRRVEMGPSFPLLPVVALAAAGAILALLAVLRARDRERVERTHQEGFFRVPSLLELGRLETDPDGPLPFGYKTVWLAVDCGTTEAAVRALRLGSVHAANWRSGLPAGGVGWVFVSPPIGSWVLAVCRDFPSLGENDAALRALCERVSEEVGECQYFATHRVVEYHAWARWIDGVLVRAYAYLGEQGRVLENFGEESEEERELGFDFVDRTEELDAEIESPEDAPQTPGEEDVLELAGAWGVSPRDLQEGGQGRGVGRIGRLQGPSRGDD